MLRRLAVRATIATAAALGAASPAWADVTAQYGSEDEGGSLVIEVADNGDLRIGHGRDGYLLVVAGKAYSVDAGPGGPLVTAAEVLAYYTRRSIEAGDIIFLASDEEDRPTFVRFVPQGPIELAGFRGIEYTPERGTHAPVGVADDPRLAPLGQAYLRYSQVTDEISADPRAVPDNLAELLATKGPLRFAGMDLRSVSFEPIDPARFALPAEPLLLEQVLADEPAEPLAGADDDFDPVVRAVYFDGALWTLTRDSKLSRWTEGAELGAPVDVPGPVGPFAGWATSCSS